MKDTSNTYYFQKRPWMALPQALPGVADGISSRQLPPQPAPRTTLRLQNLPTKTEIKVFTRKARDKQNKDKEKPGPGWPGLRRLCPSHGELPRSALMRHHLRFGSDPGPVRPWKEKGVREPFCARRAISKRPLRSPTEMLQTEITGKKQNVPL